MNEVTYRLATPADVQALVALRMAFLAEVSAADPPPDPERLRAYFATAIRTGEFLAYVAATADGQIIATSGLVEHRHPPSARNPTGREAYVMNMYTRPPHRGRGIATELLRRLVAHARSAGYCRVTLHAMPTARSIYEKVGFEAVEGEMRLWL